MFTRRAPATMPILIPSTFPKILGLNYVPLDYHYIVSGLEYLVSHYRTKCRRRTFFFGNLSKNLGNKYHTVFLVWGKVGIREKQYSDASSMVGVRRQQHGWCQKCISKHHS